MPQAVSAIGLTTGHAPFVEEARNRGELYIEQAYDLYSDENHDAWRKLYSRMQPRWERYANHHFLRGLEALNLSPDRIPRLSDINRRLRCTFRLGWAIVLAPFAVGRAVGASRCPVSSQVGCL